jgi:hypothetical protein
MVKQYKSNYTNIYKMEEEWKIAVKDYEVSNKGNIRHGNKILKCSILNCGYKYFQLVEDYKRTNHLVHHLVAKCFIGERPDELVIDHIDQNKLNNNVENLRYVTQQINCINNNHYRHDIVADTQKERKNIMAKEYAIKSGKNKQILRPRGTGTINQRENGTWRCSLKKNKIKIYDKTFKTREEAENFMANYNKK